MSVPRIQGKVGQATDGPHPGKWYFQLWLTSLGAGDKKEEYQALLKRVAEAQTSGIWSGYPEELDSLGVFGPWDTQEIAKFEMRRASKIMIEALAAADPRIDSCKFINMHTNEIEEFDGS